VIFDLTPYQDTAARQTLRFIDRAWEDYAFDSGRTAVTLSAPTGAGKTIIATALIEHLMLGSDRYDARSALRVLWVSDSPYLNKQTRDKMQQASEHLVGDRLRIIDGHFDQRVLPAGTVSFLNTQKLTASATTFRAGGRRTFDLWDTISNTTEYHGDEFLLIVDEAHRGTGRDATSATVLAQLIRGGENLRRPAPVVLGISATPHRFEQATRGMQTNAVTVDVDAVRESGLVKDRIVIAHPDEVQIADDTLLGLAVEKFRAVTNRWSEYGETNPDEPRVIPALVVQVSKGNDLDALARTLDTIQETDPSLTDANIFHAFDNHTPVIAGRHTISYRAPEAIQDDNRVRVVVFKEALTTGWDCPRAEVMISLRKAQDATYITQLIGRMIRTPLARRVTDVDALNEVSLYLPHFDKAAVVGILEQLRTGEDAVTTEVVADPIELRRNPSVPQDAWDALAGLPTYTRPSNVPRNELDRAIRLGLMLEGAGLITDAVPTLRAAVVATLDAYAHQHKITMDSRIEDFESINYSTQTVDWLTGELITHEIGRRRATSLRNVEDLFSSARRRLYDASGIWLWDYVQDKHLLDPFDAKLYVAACATLPDVLPQIASVSRSTFDAWRREHGATIATWSGAHRDEYDRLLATSPHPEETELVVPSPRTTQPSAQHWPKHLLAAAPRQIVPVDLFPSIENGWEAALLQKELAKSDVVAWYRNPRSGASALTVPYRQGDRWRLLAPDYIFLRKTDVGISVDVVDPHRPDLGDTVPKWRALARYAFENAARLGRVLAVIGSGMGDRLTLEAIDLSTEATREALLRLDEQDDIRSVFASHGFRL
jgi:type III restriction enzyme